MKSEPTPLSRIAAQALIDGVDVADTKRRAPLFERRCYLCGAWVRKGQVFCFAHSWAAGTERR